MKKWVNRYKIVVFIGLVIIAAAGTYGFKEYNRKLPDTQQLTAAFKIEAVDFVSEFEADASAATTKYAGKVVDVHGVVSSIQVTDTSGTIFLKGSTSFSSVMCQFDEKTLQEIKRLRNGDQVTIKGICSGYLMDVVMVRCIIEKVPTVSELTFFAAML